ncbi:hypothetical protein SERLA73DRAFT_191326 [Serpula lacrymans var. lacrymans S7.3]|uniref:ABM domain-containing protein n=2 Tax=Serpula lacrymans var. lacrymans TaxID=341189 RepID=F8QHB0_SERL3|nr:uncharacterized protein SERLADRAFT_477678 [Serpula lacrymans var. lacrymans S7.9]EGN92293.1 hypothetical protein SERLA73DRAFT_191326 [Serpula lacrymans var. lacrymans S7.3]EGO20266.1 hypothetical protein SERLADRAFT_477678 [Serpula lacrymans var. lacrymans S7.9]
MALPTTEILVFPTSEAYQKDPSIVAAPLDIVLKAPGVQDAFYGLQVESPDTGYIFLNWDSLKHHHDFIAAPSYPSLIESLTPSLGGAPQMYHVQFSGVLNALKEPITEVFTFKLNAPEQREKVVGLLKQAEEVSKGMIVFGQTVEDENLYYMVCGWPSIEAHQERSAQADTQAGRDFLVTAGEIGIKHTKLTLYTK